VVTEPMFVLLIACGGIYLWLGDRNEALMLLGFLAVVMGITFVQQRRSEKSLAALRDLSSPRALVVRDGVACRIAGREVVRGDVVLLAEGDRVAADMTLLTSSNLMVDESMLTGESLPVTKTAPSRGAPADDAAARVFAGTLVTQGTASGLVTATGPRGALGRIGQSLRDVQAADTPVQRETRTVVKRVALVGGALAVALAIGHGVTQGDALQGLLAGLTLAMAILPEELPVVLTLFLGLGAWRLAREDVLARHIPAVEPLGATTVLCVDKTGTLTANRMAVRALWTPDACREGIAADAVSLEEALHDTLEFAVLASHRRTFDPMEAAITAAGQRLLAQTEHLHGDWTLVDDYPLSREMLAMSRVWQSPDRRERIIAAKGAPEAIMDLCHLDAATIGTVSAQVAAMARDGLRLIAVARATFAADRLPPIQHDFDFEFLGLVALEDPLRPEVPQAIAECRAAGIRVVMITGDHPATALSIARQAGLSTEGGALTGAELAAMDDGALAECLARTQVFCRVEPAQKLRLVQAFRRRGEVVAMTGDGVNDAPALKAADIGVAMGARGSDVAREAADLVLLRDDFASLVTAVRHGRRVFANLRKAMVFVIAAHVPIVGLSLLPVALGWPLLLAPVHILFLQLIIDPACSVVFEAEPEEAGAMTAPPRPSDTRLFDLAVVGRGLAQGAGLLALLLGLHAWARSAGSPEAVARALTFSVLVMGNLALIAANRSWQPGRARRLGRNRAFGWIGAATVVLLGGVLLVPAASRQFGFELPPGWPHGLAGAAVTLLALGWFQAVKRAVGGRASVQSIEAGAAGRENTITPSSSRPKRSDSRSRR
jgi:Ca2+-transporting ATPase